MKILEPKKRRSKIGLVYLIFLGILVLSSVGVTIASTIRGSEISFLEKERQALKLENEELTAKTLSTSSLSQLSQASVSLGLVKPQTVLYLNTEAPVASLR